MDATTITSEILSKVAAAERKITKSTSDLVAGGPTAMAQKHSGENIDSKVLHDITEGEKHVTHQARPIAGGPTAVVQSHMAKVCVLPEARKCSSNASLQSQTNTTRSEEHHSAIVNPDTLSKITEAEKKITHSTADVVAGGPTAMAQRHTGESIAEALHDITEGEKSITHTKQPIAGGPTAVAMSELAKARQEIAKKQTAI